MLKKNKKRLVRGLRSLRNELTELSFDICVHMANGAGNNSLYSSPGDEFQFT